VGPRRQPEKVRSSGTNAWFLSSADDFRDLEASAKVIPVAERELRCRPMQDAATTDFVLIPGAGGQGWYWHLVQAELVRRGHRAVAIDLPGADPAAGLPEYRDLIVAAARTFAGPVTLVALSLGGFSAPLACEHVPVERLILVNAMIPRPGEPAGEWWDNVGWQAEAQAAADRDGRQKIDVTDLETLFFHDLPAPLVEQMRANREAADESPAIFGQPWPLAAWPQVPLCSTGVSLQRSSGGFRRRPDRLRDVRPVG
jgi:pimeloyl-ACP methyl ester carboxylesterase